MILLNSSGLFGPGLGKRSTAQVSAAGGGGDELPFQEDLAVWYDFTDITQLYQSLVWTTPVTANGDPIGSITDKGTRGYDLAAPATKEGKYDSATFGHGTWTYSDTGQCALIDTVPAALDAAGAGYTMFCAYRSEIGAGLGIPFKWYGTGDFEIRTQATQKVTPYLNGNVYYPAAVDVVEVWYFLIMMNRKNNTQIVHHAVVGADTTGTSSYANPRTGQPIILGAFNTSGSNYHEGHIAECGIYETVDSDNAALVADLKTYSAAKYGVVWP